ncbi:MAG: glyoxalase superfamily protein [Henriciella sp.]|nr:glyoxalase superfamily protein [Henriciella sp.]
MMKAKTMSDMTLPVTRAQAKERARELRIDLGKAGTKISHGEALERIAKELGFRDWNTASARLSNAPEQRFRTGGEVSGRYLGKPFTGRLLAVRERAGGSQFEVTVRFDQPVDVVDWESFSALRQQVKATISAAGVTAAKTSNGEPHMRVEPRIV